MRLNPQIKLFHFFPRFWNKITFLWGTFLQRLCGPLRKQTPPYEPGQIGLWKKLSTYSFGQFFVFFLCLSTVLFARPNPTSTNFIFDEQEALLANPFVRDVESSHRKYLWRDAFHLDFWGRPPESTIGSYRPLPSLVWRFLWLLGARSTPFVHHTVCIFFHALNAALLSSLVFRVTKKNQVAFLSGFFFCSSAVLTECISGVVGLADVFCGTGLLLSLHALRLPFWFSWAGVAAGVWFSLLSKESGMVAVVILPLFSLFFGSTIFRKMPLQQNGDSTLIGQTWRKRHLAKVAFGLNYVLAFVVPLFSFISYVNCRRIWFPNQVANEWLVASGVEKSWLSRLNTRFLRWYAQPILPKDALNNPFVEGDVSHRLSGALRVFWRGFTQVVFPLKLSGDYSAPQEPLPVSLFSVESLCGGVLFIFPYLLFFVFVFCLVRKSLKRGRISSKNRLFCCEEETEYGILNPNHIVCTAFFVFGFLLMDLAYFPVSNIPVLLPTVRAERFWYLPVLGTSVSFAVAWVSGFDWLKRKKKKKIGFMFLGGLVLFSSFQIIRCRMHANDYVDDLRFWDATRQSSKRSAKAHLNYSVMQGARGHLEKRLESNAIAMHLAPNWVMAKVYYADTLCRLHRGEEALSYYKEGFAMGPNEKNLIALGLQCLWDEKLLDEESEKGQEIRHDLLVSGDVYSGSWYEWLVHDVLVNGKAQNGVAKEHRPRGYNEGPK